MQTYKITTRVTPLQPHRKALAITETWPEVKLGHISDENGALEATVDGLCSWR